MWRALAAALALASVSAGPSGLAVSPGAGGAPGVAPGAGPVAINPNIAVGHCPGGGVAISLWDTMPPRTVHGALRGDIAGESLFGVWCPGYYRRAPDFCLAVTAPGGWYTMEIVEAGGVDTTLALVGGSLPAPVCDDDGATDLRSRLVVWLEPGSYDLHAGSIGPGTTGRFVLSFEAGEGW